MRRCQLLFLFAVALLLARAVPAQEIKSPPGQFDYYVLNLSWSPEFCYNLHTLSAAERAEKGAGQCDTAHGFVLHGLWPQNFDGTYPASCSNRPGPAHPERNLDMTPSLPLLKHEWAKHGTCTTLSPEAFFSTAREAYTSVHIPEAFQRVDRETSMPPAAILDMFYRSNPDFPQGSFALSCGRNFLTAVEACFSKDGKPIACQNLKSCGATSVKIQAEASGEVVQ